MNTGKKRKIKMLMIGSGIVITLIVIWLILCPPSKGDIPPILDDNGEVVQGSIAEKTFIDVNGTNLGMILLAKDQTKPVLLFLSGGPGIPEYLLEKRYPTGLENDFVVCYLSYRGTALSFDKDLCRDTMNTKQYLDDVLKVTDYLRLRFGQDKIYLMGHSFGTYIGLNMVYQYPERYEAYIAISQLCKQWESECIAYDYMLDHYKEVEDTNTVKKFLSYNIKESTKDYYKYIVSPLRDNSMHELGIGTTRDMHSIIKDIIFPALRVTEFTTMERLNIFRGKFLANNTKLVHEAWSFNAFESIQEVQVPVYFLAGKYDYTCCYSLQKKYFEQLQAPIKAFYTFENSAHSPLFEEVEKAKSILNEDVKKKATNLGDEEKYHNIK